MQVPLGQEKIQPPRQLAQTIWRGRLGISDIDTQLNYIKIKMDSKIIKSHQCSLERSHVVLIEINSEF